MLTLLLASNIASATVVTTNDGTKCDFSKVVHNKDGTFTYPLNLHLCVGKMAKDNAVKDKQIADLAASNKLYQLTIQTDEQRIQNWIQTSTSLEGRVEKVNELEKKNEWLFFALGVAATGVAAYAGEKLSGH
jgi:hypothetical protein